MFFDRYEIHIQAFLYFINGKLMFFQLSSGMDRQTSPSDPEGRVQGLESEC